MSATVAPASRSMILRQSRFFLRRNQFRTASTAAETASKAKEVASNTASKASEGLSRVQSSAGSSISKYASSAQNALGRIGGRTGRMIKFVESLIPPTVYYTRVGLELGKMIGQHQKMAPPSISTFQSYLQPITNLIRNPRSFSMPAPEGLLSSVRNANSSQLTSFGIIFAQILGFFTIGEMIGRMKLVGYHGEPHHE